MIFMMKKNNLNKSYWENRYAKNEIGWNIGEVSTPIKAYIDQLTDKTFKILVPGAGNGYEAEYLWRKGFKSIFIVDFAKEPLENFKKRVPDFPSKQLLNMDFFEVIDRFDLILEQTFFCALQSNLRSKYIEQMHAILKPKGKLVGLFFDFPLTTSGPPFGGDSSEYKLRFNKTFKIKILEKSYNSIKERQGKELFFIFEKK